MILHDDDDNDQKYDHDDNDQKYDHDDSHVDNLCIENMEKRNGDDDDDDDDDDENDEDENDDDDDDDDGGGVYDVYHDYLEVKYPLDYPKVLFDYSFLVIHHYLLEIFQ
jgi:hypothetical protein